MPRASSPRRSPKPCPDGKVRNPSTGRCIKVDGPTHKKIHQQKHTPILVIESGKFSVKTGHNNTDKKVVEVYVDSKGTSFVIMGRNEDKTDNRAMSTERINQRKHDHDFKGDRSDIIIRRGSRFVDRFLIEEYDERLANRLFTKGEKYVTVYKARGR